MAKRINLEKLPNNILEALFAKHGFPKIILLKSVLHRINSEGKLDEKELAPLESKFKELYAQWRKCADNGSNPGGICLKCFTILKKGSKVKFLL